MDPTQLERLIQALEANTKAASESSDQSGSRPGGSTSTLSFEGLAGAEKLAEIKKLEAEIESLKGAYDGLYRSISQGNEIEEKQIELNIKKVLASDKSIEQKKKEVEELKKAYKTLRAETSATTQASQTLQKALGLTLGGPAEKLVKLGQDMAEVKKKHGSMGKVLKGVGKALAARAMMKPIELFVNNTIALAIAQDKAVSAFRKATGATAEYNY
ncbi:MAG: hypothetical protein HN566_12585, partial [Polaribacter sp.]|nr:hypothetical protein [Polaribacter sp.]